MKGIRITDTSRRSIFLFLPHSVATPTVPRLLVSALLGALVSGCSSTSMGRLGATSVPATNLALDVANASKGTFTGEEERESEALHHFMVGQLSLGQEDFDGALANFEKADELTDEPVAIIHTRLADLYLRFGKLDKARMAAEKAMAADPTEPYVRMLYAGVLESLGKEGEAEPIYRTLVQDYPNRVDGYLLLSNLYVKEKRFDQATNTLTTLLRHQPQEPLGHFYLGRIYEHLGKLDKAEVEYAWVVEHDPNLSSGSTELLRVLVHQKKNGKAKEMCERILQKDPNNALARKVLSHLMLGESKLDDALQHLTVLEGLEGDPSETRFKVALIQIEKQNYREAVRELSLVLAKNPQHAEARYYLASIYAGSGKRKEAIEELGEIDKESSMYVKARTFAAFILRQDDELSGALDAIDEALASDSDNINLMLYRVLVLRDLHEDRAAEKQLRVALERHPDDERLLFNLGLVLHDRGKETEAIATMERIIHANPQSSDALNYVAYALAETGGDLERAERLARQALEIRSADGYYLDTLGFVQWKRGNIAEAEETLARAVGAAGDDSVIVEHYVEILLQQGKNRQAVSVLKAFLEQPQDNARQRDEDKVAAWKRLQKRLDELLRSHPEFQGIEKSQIIPTTKTKKLQALSGLELLDQMHVQEGEAFDR